MRKEYNSLINNWSTPSSEITVAYLFLKLCCLKHMLEFVIYNDLEAGKSPHLQFIFLLHSE